MFYQSWCAEMEVATTVSHLTGRGIASFSWQRGEFGWVFWFYCQGVGEKPVKFSASGVKTTCTLWVLTRGKRRHLPLCLKWQNVLVQPHESCSTLTQAASLSTSLHNMKGQGFVLGGKEWFCFSWKSSCSFSCRNCWLHSNQVSSGTGPGYSWPAPLDGHVASLAFLLDLCLCFKQNGD